MSARGHKASATFYGWRKGFPCVVCGNPGRDIAGQKRCVGGVWRFSNRHAYCTNVASLMPWLPLKAGTWKGDGRTGFRHDLTREQRKQVNDYFAFKEFAGSDFDSDCLSEESSHCPTYPDGKGGTELPGTRYLRVLSILADGDMSSRDVEAQMSLRFGEAVSHVTTQNLRRQAFDCGDMEADGTLWTAKQQERRNRRGAGRAHSRGIVTAQGLARLAAAGLRAGTPGDGAATPDDVEGMTTREQLLWNDIKSAYRTRILVELLDEAEGHVFDLEDAEGALHDVDALIEDVLGEQDDAAC